MWLMWVLLASVGLGAGATLQKHGVATQLPDLAAIDLWRRPRSILRIAFSNRIWLGGGVANLLGALCLMLALKTGELSVVQPLTNLNLAVSVVAGVLVLGERLVRAERLAIVALVAGAVLVSISGLRATVVQVAPSFSALLVSALLCAGAVAVLHVMGRAPGARRHPEVALGLSAGLLYGLGAACLKALLVQVDSLNEVLAAAALVRLAPAFVGVVFANLGGYLLEQVAFSRGRVSVVDPLCTGGGLLMTVTFGALFLGERLDGLRLVGLTTLLCSLTWLMWNSARAHPERLAKAAICGVAK